MTEALYGGDGAKRRTEYEPLQDSELAEKSLQATRAIDELFESGYLLETVNTMASSNSGTTEREMAVSYIVFDKEFDDFMMYNTTTNDIEFVEGKSTSYIKDIVVRHAMHRTGVHTEEYFISFERQLPHVSRAFFHTYLFEFMVGGSVKVTVESNNIEVDDGNEGNVFERQISAYDLNELYKELAEVADHFNAGHKEIDIDRRLTERLQ